MSHMNLIQCMNVFDMGTMIFVKPTRLFSLFPCIFTLVPIITGVIIENDGYLKPPTSSIFMYEGARV